MSESVSVCQCAGGPKESKEEKPTAPLLPAPCSRGPALAGRAAGPALGGRAAGRPICGSAADQQAGHRPTTRADPLAIFAWCSVRAASE